MNIDDLQTVWAPRVRSVLRIVAALLFMEHGTQKLLGFPPSPNPGPALLSMFGIAGVLELIGGAFLAVGLFTRPVAFILSGEMAIAYWMAHAPRSFFPILNGGDTASSSSISPRPAAGREHRRHAGTRRAALSIGNRLLAGDSPDQSVIFAVAIFSLGPHSLGER
jgi:putative oxidoreductase